MLVAVTPDGSHIVSAFGYPYRFDKWDATSLTKVRAYGEEPTFVGYPAAVAISPDGSFVAGGRQSGLEMALYDATTGAKTYAEDTPVGELVVGGIAFSGSDVFSVLRSESDRLYLWRLHGVTLPASPPPR